MRYEIVVAVAALVLSVTGAQAEDWCGYTAKDNAVIECGYTTASGCQDAVGKGGVCFVDPDIALSTKPKTPALAAKPSTGHG